MGTLAAQLEHAGKETKAQRNTVAFSADSSGEGFCGKPVANWASIVESNVNGVGGSTLEDHIEGAPIESGKSRS